MLSAEPDPRGAPPFDFHSCEKQVENWDGEGGGEDGVDDGGDEHLSEHQSHQREESVGENSHVLPCPSSLTVSTFPASSKPQTETQTHR